MRERISNTLRSFAASLCIAALCSLFLALVFSLYDSVRMVDLPVLRWAALLLVLALIDEILASRGLPLLLYAAVNAAAAAAGITFILAATVFMPESEGYAVFLGFLIASSTALCAYFAQQLPDSNVFIRLCDALLIGIALLMASVGFLDKSLNEEIVVFAAAALVTALVMTAQLRAGGESENVVRGSGIGGALVLFAVLAVCLLLCAALIVLGGDQVDGIVAAAVSVWKKLGWLAEKVVYVFAALLSLNFGKHNVLEPDAGHYKVTIVPLNDEKAMGTAPMWLVYGFIGLLALALIVLAVALLMDLRGKRVLRAGRTGRRRVVTRKSHMLSAILALFARLRDAAAFEMTYRFGQRMPQTLYVFAQRRFRLTRLAKSKSESPSAYLRRLDGALRAQGDASSLDALAVLMDEAIYGGKNIVMSKEEFAAYSAQICLIRAAEKKK